VLFWCLMMHAVTDGLVQSCSHKCQTLYCWYYYFHAAIDAGTTSNAALATAEHSTLDGRTTTLGRNGSDYTATLLGAALAAEAVVVNTDVSGVMTADPGIVPDAQPVVSLSYEEALELAAYGTRIFHPRTMLPLMETGE
jgi:Amino acid kinase family